MNKGNSVDNSRAYQQMMDLACAGYNMKEANLEDFIKRAIPQLPHKMRKQLDKFFGIIGGVNYLEKISRKYALMKPISDTERQMYSEALKAVRKLDTVDYLILYREDAKELMKKIAKKVTGTEDTLTKTKWALLYATIICGGPFFFRDLNKVKDPRELHNEMVYTMSTIKLMEDAYINVFKPMPDGELLIDVVKAWVEDLDIKDRIAILKFFNIKVPNYLSEFEAEEIGNIFEVRKLKERIFFNGPWATDGRLFTKTGILSQNIKEGFYEAFELMKNGAEIKRSEPEDYSFGTGERPVSFYKIDGPKEPYEFPYIEEIMLAFRYWNDITEESDCAS